jgi:DNA processing protein
VSFEISAFAIFRLLEIPGMGPVRIVNLLNRAKQERGSTEFVADREFLKQTLSADQLKALSANEPKARRVWDDVSARNIRAISILDPRYPESIRLLLGSQAPPLLFLLGNEQLFMGPSVGFCGSRKASEKGLAVAAECAAEFARHKINVVSGYASGVDMKASYGALASGGTTTVVLAEGALHFRVKREIRDVWEDSKVLVLSQFLPSVPWSVHNAMERNRIICALSRAMLLIEARNRSGSMAAGRECLKMRIPLFAAVYEGSPETAEGNREILAAGGKPLYKKRSTNAPNVRPVLETLPNSPQRLGPPPFTLTHSAA